MLHGQALHDRLAQARSDCIARLQLSADWLEQADLGDRDELRHCAHRLIGTLGSFGFVHALALARALEERCQDEASELEGARKALATALRDLAAK